jgi:hypothetical protein
MAEQPSVGQGYHDIRLGEIRNWPEAKATWEIQSAGRGDNQATKVKNLDGVTMSRIVLSLSTAVGILFILSGAEVQAAKEGKKYGTVTRIQCDAGLWCDPRPGRCGVKDVKGTCVKIPQNCSRIYRPVCGCNGQTYSIDCERRKSKVAKDHIGICRSP